MGILNNITDEQLALYLKIARDQRDRMKQKFIQQFGVQSEPVKSINKELAALRGEIEKIETGGNQTDLERPKK